jgi:hypothetical protein
MPTADPRDRRLRLLFFGTYDVRTHPRVQVLIDGCRALGDEVVECNVPLGVGTADRVAALRRPYLVPLLAGRLLRAWAALAWRARRLPGSGPFDAVVVGYLGHFDVHLARLLFDRTTLVLDQMVFAADTATDRRLDVGWRPRLLGRIDGAAVSAAAVTIVDTAEQVALVPAELRARAVVVRWARRSTGSVLPPSCRTARSESSSSVSTRRCRARRRSAGRSACSPAAPTSP